jgi:hypothetical protein
MSWRAGNGNLLQIALGSNDTQCRGFAAPSNLGGEPFGPSPTAFLRPVISLSVPE